MLSSPMVAIVFFLVVYAAGGLVEVFADLFIRRLTGNTAWAINAPKYMFQKTNKFFRPILKALAYYPGIGFILYAEWAKAFIGKSSYKWIDLDKQLRPRAREHLKSLPDIVREGIKDPFGGYGDLPWRYFSSHGVDHDVRALARKLENRNKDVLVVVTALLIAANVVFLTQAPEFFANGRDGAQNSATVIQEPQHAVTGEEANKKEVKAVKKGFVVIQMLMLILVFFLGSYFLLTRQSLLTIIEYDSLSAQGNKIGVDHNNAMHPTTIVAGAPAVSGDR